MHTLHSLVVIALSVSLTLADAPEPASVDQLIEALASNDFAERERAIDTLATRREEVKKHAPQLRKQLASKDQASREQAAMALGALGIAEPMVLDELLAGMGRRSRAAYLSQPERARSFVSALTKLEAKAVPALVKALDDDKYASRDLALEALGRIGPAAKEALPAIEKRLATDDVPAFCCLVEVKWRIDGDTKYAIEQMTPLLDTKAGRQYHAAVRTLVHMGSDAKDAMPALLAALKKYKDHNLLWAVGELAPHAKDLALPALREALDDARLADDAAIALHNLGEPAEKLIPLQLRRLAACKPKDGSEPMRIVYTIVIHGPAARDYFADLRPLLKHENPEVRRAAAWALPRMFAGDQPVIAALKEALEDPEAKMEAEKSLKMLEEARK